MNSNTFWKLIEETRTASHYDNDLMLELLQEKLTPYSPGEIARFNQYLGFYMGVTDTIPLWMAGKTIQGYCSDGTFLYFRLWLISLGKEALLNAIKYPDSLADLDIEKYSLENREFEMLMGLDISGDFEALSDKLEGLNSEEQHEILAKMDFTAIRDSQLTETELHELRDDIIFADDSDVLESQEEALEKIPIMLPKLCQKFSFSPDESIDELQELHQMAAQVQAGNISPKQIAQTLSETFRSIGLDEDTIQNLTQSFQAPKSSEKYDLIAPLQSGLSMVQKNGKYGFINPEGDEVIPLIYDYAQTFCLGKEDFTPVKLNDKYGYIDPQGKEIIPIVYDELDEKYTEPNGNPTITFRGKKDGKWHDLFTQILS